MRYELPELVSAAAINGSGGVPFLPRPVGSWDTSQMYFWLMLYCNAGPLERTLMLVFAWQTLSHINAAPGSRSCFPLGTSQRVLLPWPAL